MNEIERREWLKTALFGGASAVALSGCAPQRPAASPRSVSDVAKGLDPIAAEQLLASLDKRLEWIDREHLPDDVWPVGTLRKTPQFEQERERRTVLARKAMRSLYLTGRVLDLPDELKAHPGIQARVAALEPDMDDAVLGMTELIENMTPQDHRHVQNRLDVDPGFGERLAHYVERPAVDDGIPFRRRFGVRGGILQLTQRMSAQSPSLITDPIVKKVRRIQARPRSDAEQMRLMAARMGEEAFWAHQERMAVLHQAWHERLGTETYGVGAGARVTAADLAPVYGPGRQEQPSRGKRTVKTGTIVMGFGGASIAAGLLFWGIAEATAVEGFIWPALVLGVTIGPILLLVGLIIVIVGAIQRRSEPE